MLAPNDRFPHVSLRRVDGTPFTYGDIWQRRHLLLVVLADDGVDRAAEEDRYLAELAAFDDELRRYETTVVVTREAVAGVKAPAVLIADRWGEVVTVTSGADMASLPGAEDVMDWFRMIARACSW